MYWHCNITYNHNVLHLMYSIHSIISLNLYPRYPRTASRFDWNVLCRQGFCPDYTINVPRPPYISVEILVVIFSTRIWPQSAISSCPTMIKNRRFTSDFSILNDNDLYTCRSVIMLYVPHASWSRKNTVWWMFDLHFFHSRI